MAADSGWELYVAQSGDEIVGFVAVQLDQETHFRIGPPCVWQTTGA
jgi:hypothetical protein